MADVPEDQKVVKVLETRFNHSFAQTAEELRPQLHTWERSPQRLVHFEKDASEFFGVKALSTEHAVKDLPGLCWGKKDEFTLDFGIHMVGHLSFTITGEGVNIDAPCRLRLTFCESPYDATEDMSSCDTWISTSWLPQEIINIDWLPCDVTIPRRFAFRYVRVHIVDTSPKYKVKFSNVSVNAVSAVAPEREVEIFEYHDTLLQEMDKVSIYTLRDCMQTVFEDGPRRDRRLWIGDLRLQALTNYHTFKDYDLVKRCLFLFAALPREDESLPACPFEKPKLAPASDYIVDYDALFAPTVCDYVVASGDKATGELLWSTVQGCLKKALAHLDPTTFVFDSSSFPAWKFLDWAPGLDTSAGLHGVLLYSLRSASVLAELLGKTSPYTETISKMTTAASVFLDQDSKMFVSGPKRQVSLASAAWLSLSQAFPTSVAKTALCNAMSNPQTVKPLTPYLYHHVCEALATNGAEKECIDLMKKYWGGMVNAGADTFWECFNSEDPRSSPYGDIRNNSFCHAWSCTPSYLLRDKLRGFGGYKVVESVTMDVLDKGWIKQCTEATDGVNGN